MRRPELLRDRRLLALLVAETVSTTGSQMTWLALPWFVLVTSGSATRMSFVMAAELLGLALLGLPGGRSQWAVCRDCGLVYQRPRPDAAAVAQLYGGGSYHANRGGVPERLLERADRRRAGGDPDAFGPPSLVSV